MNGTEFLAYFSHLPNELTVFVLSLLPLVEMRLAFPIGVYLFDLNPWLTLGITFSGSVILVAGLYWVFPPIFRWLEQHWQWFHRVLEQRLRKLALKHEKLYQRFGALFLFLFVVDPFPGTGVWTAVPLAILLGMNPRFSIPAILLGSLVSGYLAAFVTQGALFFF